MRTPLQLVPCILQHLLICSWNNIYYYSFKITNNIDFGFINVIFVVERCYVMQSRRPRDGTVSSYPSLRKLIIQISPNLQSLMRWSPVLLKYYNRLQIIQFSQKIEVNNCWNTMFNEKNMDRWFGYTSIRTTQTFGQLYSNSRVSRGCLEAQIIMLRW